jgi:hypothetical protein
MCAQRGCELLLAVQPRPSTGGVTAAPEASMRTAGWVHLQKLQFVQGTPRRRKRAPELVGSKVSAHRLMGQFQHSLLLLNSLKLSDAEQLSDCKQGAAP